MSSSAAASGTSSQDLASLEQEILATITTLDRLEEFAQPSLQPDNAALSLNLNQLVERLDAMYPRHDLGAEFEADALAFTFNAFDATAVQLTTAAPPSDP